MQTKHFLRANEAPPPPRPPMQHELKCWPEYFEAVYTGLKTFDCRRNDRDFRVGDVLVLQEFMPGPNPFGGEHTGRSLRALVTYVLPGSKENQRLGIEEGFCVMSIKFITDYEQASGRARRKVVSTRGRSVG